jgi:hypothetical protein
MMATLSRGKMLFAAAAAAIMLLAGAAFARGDDFSSIRLLFTGGVTAHREPSG